MPDKLKQPITGVFGKIGSSYSPAWLEGSPVSLGSRAIDGDLVGVLPGVTGARIVEANGLVLVVQGRWSEISGGSGQKLLSWLESYRSADVHALAQLPGPFALALVDRPNRRLVLAVDRLGVEQMFFARTTAGMAFASSVSMLVRLLPDNPALSLQGLFDYMYFHVVPSPRSIYDNVTRLLPGEYVVFENGFVEQGLFWRAEFNETSNAGFVELKSGFVAALEAAVHEAVDGSRCGAFLSGGTDSSTIAGLIGRVTGTPANTYSIGFDAEGYDEMSYARIAAKHFGTRHHEYYVTPDDVVAAIPELARVHDQPFGNSSAVPAYYCAKMAAADGMQMMVAGDGGDELFGGNARYATQQLFAKYEALPEWIRNGVIQPVSRRLPTTVAPLRKVRSYVEQASTPMPERTETYNLLRRTGYAQVFRPEFIASVDVQEPLALQSTFYFNPTANSLINRQLALDIKFTLADNDLRKVVRSCELAGLPVAFPMLHERVVDFSLGLAPDLKLKGTQLRYFFKQALSDFLPEAILRKHKHGFGLPFGAWAVEYRGLREIAFDNVAALEKRRIFDSGFLATLPRRLQEHPAYYGTMVWVLMMLEQWLDAHAPEFKL